MHRHRKRATAKARALPSVFNDDPAHDDPHDAIEQELLGIWLGLSRLRELIRDTAAADGCVIALQQAPAKKTPSKKSAQRKPRRKAA